MPRSAKAQRSIKCFYSGAHAVQGIHLPACQASPTSRPTPSMTAPSSVMKPFWFCLTLDGLAPIGRHEPSPRQFRSMRHGKPSSGLRRMKRPVAHNRERGGDFSRPKQRTRSTTQRLGSNAKLRLSCSNLITLELAHAWCRFTLRRCRSSPRRHKPGDGFGGGPPAL